MSVNNYYKTLNIARDASKPAIRKAYLTLAKRYHPDVNKAPNADKLFQEIQEAYSVLSDDGQRHKYDERLRATEGGTTGPSGSSSSSGGSQFYGGARPRDDGRPWGPGKQFWSREAYEAYHQAANPSYGQEWQRREGAGFHGPKESYARFHARMRAHDIEMEYRRQRMERERMAWGEQMKDQYAYDMHRMNPFKSWLFMVFPAFLIVSLFTPRRQREEGQADFATGDLLYDYQGRAYVRGPDGRNARIPQYDHAPPPSSAGPPPQLAERDYTSVGPRCSGGRSRGPEWKKSSSHLPPLHLPSFLIVHFAELFYLTSCWRIAIVCCCCMAPSSPPPQPSSASAPRDKGSLSDGDLFSTAFGSDVTPAQDRQLFRRMNPSKARPQPPHFPPRQQQQQQSATRERVSSTASNPNPSVNIVTVERRPSLEFLPFRGGHSYDDQPGRVGSVSSSGGTLTDVEGFKADQQGQQVSGVKMIEVKASPLMRSLAQLQRMFPELHSGVSDRVLLSSNGDLEKAVAKVIRYQSLSNA